MSMEQDNFYRTSDFSLAAALAVWLPIEAVDHTDARRAYFIFRQTTELKNLIESYHRRDLRIEPQSYFQAIKSIKARLYE